MFDIGWSELLLIGVVALIVIGPKELPGVLRSLGKGLSTVRKMAGEFQGQFQEALREAELDGLKKEVDDLRATAASLNPLNTIRNELSSIEQTIKDPLSLDAGSGGAEGPEVDHGGDLDKPAPRPAAPAAPPAPASSPVAAPASVPAAPAPTAASAPAANGATPVSPAPVAINLPPLPEPPPPLTEKDILAAAPKPAAPPEPVKVPTPGGTPA